MPQTNITYDTRYNNGLVETLREMEEKNFNYNCHQYHPSPMGFRNADSFHDPESVARVQKVQLTGGVAPSRYILNGNSPAYPPLNMAAALQISSGGGRNEFIGVDGAVSGGKFNLGKTARSVLDVAKEVAPIVMMAAGRDDERVVGGKFNVNKAVKSLSKGVKTAAAVAKTGKEAYDLYNSVMGGGTQLMPMKTHDLRRLDTFSRKLQGGNSLSDVLKVVKEIAPLVLPILMGAGHSCSKAGDKVLLVEKAMKKLQGGAFWKSFGKNFKKGAKTTLDVAKELAPIVVPLMMAAGRAEHGSKFNMGKFVERKGRTIPQRKAVSGGVNLKDAIAATTSMGSKAVKEVKKRGSKAVKEVAKQAVKAVANDILDTVKAKRGGVASGGGRSARAAIVKKVMADKGLKMIAASQYVKQHGLY